MEAAHLIPTIARDGAPGSADLLKSGFEAVFFEHYGAVVGVLARIVEGRAEAEELASEVFFRFYQHVRAGKPESNPAGWLYRTATRLGIDAWRSKRRRRHYEQKSIEAVADHGHRSGPLEDMLRVQEQARVRTALSRMKPARAEILLLRANGLSYREVAGALGVAVSGVGTLICRAQADFKKQYLKICGKAEVL